LNFFFRDELAFVGVEKKRGRRQKDRIGGEAMKKAREKKKMHHHEM